MRTTAVRDELLAANESVNWYPEHIKHGRMGNWLESNVDWALSRERYWGTPLPIWRAEDGETICVGSRAELRGARRRGARRPAPPVRRRRPPSSATAKIPARAGPDRRLVGLGLHAVRAVARAVRERGQVRGALPGRLHLRGARPDARLVLLAARDLDDAVRPLVVRDVPLPRPDPRRRGPEDVEVEGQRRASRGTCSTPTARTRSAGTTSPRSSRGTATASRSRRSASRCGSS